MHPSGATCLSRTIKVLVKYKANIFIISLNATYSRHGIYGKLLILVLSNKP